MVSRKRLTPLALALGAALVTGMSTSAWAVSTLPAGAMLVPRSLDDDGSHVLGLRRGGSDCWTLQSFVRRGTAWEEGSKVAGPGGTCRPVRAAAGGETAVVFDYGGDRADTVQGLPNAASKGSSLAISGTKSFSNPPPSGVAVAPDGNAIVLGTANYECKVGFPQRRCGTAQLFSGAGGAWRALQTFAFPETGPFNVEFGHAVAVGPGGAIVAAGGPGRGGDQGEIYLYERQGGSYREAGVLVPDQRNESSFGSDVAISADGRIIVVGGDQAAYVYGRDGSGWMGLARIPAPEARAGYFGAAVAISRDGSRILVGAPRANCRSGQSRCGAAYLFERRGGSWTLASSLEAPKPTPETDFGYALALDGTGEHAAVQGDSVYMFDLAAP